MLCDLLARTADLDAFYTDAGVLPRSLLRIPRWRFSVHALAGGRLGEEILFLAAAAFAVLLLVGLWPRLAAFASWAFLASLQARNPLVLNHGDELMRIFLFWSIFVPLSPAGRSGIEGGKRHLSVFSAALVIQVCLVYLVGALLKTDPSWRVTGTAISTALGLEQLSTSAGRVLLDWPRLLRAVTLWVYYLELLGPLLVFVPWRNRRIREVVILSFLVIHLGIAATMNLGPFPWVSLLGWVLLLPSETIDRLQAVLGGKPAVPPPRALEPAPGRTLAGTALQVLGSYLLLAVLVWNVRGLVAPAVEVAPTPLDDVLLLAQLDQRWNMFAPKPNYVSGWYATDGELADGSHVDPMKAGQPFTRQRPDVIAAAFPDFRWRKYLINLTLPRFERYRPALAAYLRENWDRTHSEGRQVRRLTVYFLWQNLSVEGVSPVATNVIAESGRD